MKSPTIEQLVKSYKKAEGIIEEAEGEKSVVRQAIIDELHKMKLTGMKVGGWLVTSGIRTIFTDVPMSWAEEHAAIQTKKVLDTTVLRALEAKGIKIPAAKRIPFLLIKEAK